MYVFPEDTEVTCPLTAFHRSERIVRQLHQLNEALYLVGLPIASEIVKLLNDLHTTCKEGEKLYIEELNGIVSFSHKSLGSTLNDLQED